MSRYVVSLGGNALGNNAEEQKALLVGVAKSIVHLIKLGNEVILVHGNGPQVGMINLAFTESTSAPDMPFPECGAMSQGYIGFHIQNAIYNALKEEGIKRNVVTLVSQVLVDKDDPMFQNPTKPVGAFYSEEEAKKLAAEKGYSIKEDAGRGWRRVVASPLPIDVIEKVWMRWFLHTLSGVLSTKLMPVHLPSNTFLMNRARGMATSFSSSTKRL